MDGRSRYQFATERDYTSNQPVQCSCKCLRSKSALLLKQDRLMWTEAIVLPKMVQQWIETSGRPPCDLRSQISPHFIHFIFVEKLFEGQLQEIMLGKLKLIHCMFLLFIYCLTRSTPIFLRTRLLIQLVCLWIFLSSAQTSFSWWLTSNNYVLVCQRQALLFKLFFQEWIPAPVPAMVPHKLFCTTVFSLWRDSV